MQRIWCQGYQLAGHGCQTAVVECEVGESSRFLLGVALSADAKKQEWVSVLHRFIANNGQAVWL